MSDEPKKEQKPRQFELEDALAIVGLVLFAAGAWMAYHPAAPMFAGAMLFFYAWVKARPAKPPEN